MTFQLRGSLSLMIETAGNYDIKQLTDLYPKPKWFHFFPMLTLSLSMCTDQHRIKALTYTNHPCSVTSTTDYPVEYQNVFSYKKLSIENNRNYSRLKLVAHSNTYALLKHKIRTIITVSTELLYGRLHLKRNYIVPIHSVISTCKDKALPQDTLPFLDVDTVLDFNMYHSLE